MRLDCLDLELLHFCIAKKGAHFLLKNCKYIGLYLIKISIALRTDVRDKTDCQSQKQCLDCLMSKFFKGDLVLKILQ